MSFPVTETFQLWEQNHFSVAENIALTIRLIRLIGPKKS